MTSEGSLARALGLSHEQAIAAHEAVRIVALAGDGADAKCFQLMSTVRAALGVSAGDAPAAVDLASAFPSERERRALLDALVIPACIGGEVTPARERAVQSFAQRLGVRSHWVELLPALRRRRVLSVKRALVARSPDGRRLFRRVWQEEGAPGLFRVVLFVLGLTRDPALAARFHALAGCPEGSFGRAVIEHFHARGLAFPGEKGGLPERMMHHDLLHVLNGYDTDAAGECELAAFYAASVEGDAFTFFVTVLATFHLGMGVSPAVVTPTRDAFDPERVLAAFLRGRALRVDVMGAWDYWALMPLPIDEARRQLGLEASPSTTAPSP